MKNLEDVFINFRKLDLTDSEVVDSLYRISDWLSVENASVKDDYIQNQLSFLETKIKK